MGGNACCCAYKRDRLIVAWTSEKEKQTMFVVYGYSVRSFVPLLVFGNHHGNFELIETLLGKRDADISAKIDMKTECMGAKDSYLVCLIIHAMASTEQ